MDDRKSGFLSDSKIPKTFQDAITVTQKLGFRYLWIGSLCIIQEDVVDWAREASCMAGVYRCAYLTIGALNASNDQQGFLTPRKLPDWELRVFTTSADEKSTTICMRHHGDKFISPATFALDNRAWTLQEQYLSNRMLRFSDFITTWICQETRHEEHEPSSDEGGQNGALVLCLPRDSRLPEGCSLS